VIFVRDEWTWGIYGRNYKRRKLFLIKFIHNYKNYFNFRAFVEFYMLFAC
jgi:hypothetical protein